MKTVWYWIHCPLWGCWLRFALVLIVDFFFCFSLAISLKLCPIWVTSCSIRLSSRISYTSEWISATISAIIIISVPIISVTTSTSVRIRKCTLVVSGSFPFTSLSILIWPASLVWKRFYGFLNMISRTGWCFMSYLFTIVTCYISLEVICIWACQIDCRLLSLSCFLMRFVS